jgi:hypothetical protein
MHHGLKGALQNAEHVSALSTHRCRMHRRTVLRKLRHRSIAVQTRAIAFDDVAANHEGATEA